MVHMGYNMQDIQESLSENKFDELCATYLLLGIQKDQQVLSNPSSSSLSPIGLEHSISHTPSSVNPVHIHSTHGDASTGYSKHPPPPSPSTKTSSAGTPSIPSQKKISAPGVATNVSDCYNKWIFIMSM